MCVNFDIDPRKLGTVPKMLQPDSARDCKLERELIKSGIAALDKSFPLKSIQSIEAACEGTKDSHHPLGASRPE